MRELTLAVAVAACLAIAAFLVSANVALDVLTPSAESAARAFLTDAATGRRAIARARIAETVRPDWPEDRLRALRETLRGVEQPWRLAPRSEERERAVYEIGGKHGHGAVALARERRSREWRIVDVDVR